MTRPLFLQRLDAIVAQHPRQIALQEPGACLSYEALAQALRQEAAALRDRGFAPGSLRILERPRSIAFVIEALACWEAGGAFLPLDPATPPARRAAIRAQAAAQGPGAAAYLIYTSGSSGYPKGVRVGHPGLVPVLDAQIQAFGLGPGKRALWLLSPAFDASLSDIGTALLSGATLCIPPHDLTPDDLSAFCSAERISHADLPPSLLPLLQRLPDCMEVLVIGGEVCAPEAVRYHARRRRVINVYGPTEATICTSMGPCDETWSRPLLGQPLPHVRYRIEDEQGAEALEGELCIGGDALALGYVGQPELEAARFVERGQERWYRTGDRVRRLPDGAYEFLGRIDRQIKRRGQLVAPEEIEARLREHPAVREAAVVEQTRPRPGRPPFLALVAFVSLRRPEALPELQAHLRAHLPRALCPRLLALETLPRGVSGKVDLKALQEARPPQQESPPEATAAGALCELFGEILGLGGVETHEDFFELGGDSLSALELLAAAEQRGLWIPLEALYREGTPAALAATQAYPRSNEELRARVAHERALREEPDRWTCEATGGELLLTGGTGFLGSRLLLELARLPTLTTLHVLVRAPDRWAARARLEQALGRPVDALPCPVEVWPGDAERAAFGLRPAEWEDLCHRVRTVVHGAARVHLLAPLDTLWRANVGAAAQVRELGRAGSPKRLIHVSTLSVLVASDHPGRTLHEGSDRGLSTHLYGGYAQSKWAAEELLGPVEHQVVTPVDHAARALARIVATPGGARVHHVASQRGASLAALVAALQAEGAPCEAVPPAEFYRRARAHGGWSAAMATLSLGRLLGQERRGADLFLLSDRALDCSATEALTGLPAPAIDAALLRRYVRAALARHPAR